MERRRKSAFLQSESSRVNIERDIKKRRRSYVGVDFQNLLKPCGVRGSMSRKGNCWDNAVTATLFGALKVERRRRMRFETRARAKQEIDDWLAFYNRKRLRSTLGYRIPIAFEGIRRRLQNTLAA